MTFEDLIDEHGVLVLRLCRALLQPADADEAWSETFLAALRSYPTLRNQTNLRGWLVTIAHRKSLDIIRRAKRLPIPTDVIEPLTADSDPNDREVLDFETEGPEELVRALPDKQQRAVSYRILGELSYAEVAHLLRCSEDAARRSVSDGLASLRKSRNTQRANSAKKEAHR